MFSIIKKLQAQVLEDEEVLRSAGYCRPAPSRKAHSPTAEEVAAHISDEDLRTMKTQGDA